MLSDEVRARTERFQPARVRARIYNPQARPHWIGNSDRFWYRRESPDGVSIMVVDAETGRITPADDPAALTAQPEPDPPGEVRSPDGMHAAFRRGADLWVRELGSGFERQLTLDGVPHHEYAKSPDMNLTTITLARRRIMLPPGVLWSPDSTRLFTSRLDERAVADLPLVQHVPDSGVTRPVLHTIKVAHVGDPDLPMERHVVIDAATGEVAWARSGPHVAGVMTCIEKGEAWWSPDSTRVFFLDHDRFSKRLTLHELDAATGVVREVISETAETFHEVNISVIGLCNIRVLTEQCEVIWFSQRDGWAHLYLYDLQTGALKNRITEGEWVVRDLVHVDPVGQWILFLAGGVDPKVSPYYRTLCSVGFDGSAFKVLTPEPYDHSLAFPQRRQPRDAVRPVGETGDFLSPSGRFFVHTHSTLERLPVSVLRRIDGSVVAELETASLDPALAKNWRWPEPFTAKAADDVTDLYGAIWRPSDFDPRRKYPVIDYIYPGPQRGQTPTVMLADKLTELFNATVPQSFAELGFVVVNLDGRGTPLRSKAFHDFSYGKMRDPGSLADHVHVLRELALRHTEIDLRRVGIMGHSGGGYASVRALLEYPEFFHAAVATSGNHDQRGYSFSFPEKYQGPFVRNVDGSTNYDDAANPPLAHRLKGKLLLAYGEMDDNVHPALTLQLIAALIKADKDFDVIVLPNDDHTTVWNNPYFLRRAMEFMVRHLHAA
jgi:dipeptidyl aminopeptidase/acylaminoacyl peptidase